MAVFSIQHISIQGVSATVPSVSENNCDLQNLNEQEKKNLITTTGIEKRRIANEKTTASDLCIDSAKNLMQELSWTPAEVDILIFVTQTPDHTIPGSSMYIQHQLGIPSTCLAIDINQGCAGYIYGLSVISSMMSSGKLKKGLLLVGDTITKTIHKNDQSLIPVFSDAGSCTALTLKEDATPMHYNLQTDGSGYDKIIVQKGGARKPAGDHTEEGCFLYMNGQDIFNFGLKEVTVNVQTLLNEYSIKKEEIDYFVMHQANFLLNETIRKKVGIESGKTLYSLKEYGNTSCASVPVTLAVNGEVLEAARRSKVLLAGFGVGLSWGSVLVDLKDCKFVKLHEYSR